MKVAIVGSSPRLLMAALQFSSDGDEVTLFEQQAELGGAWRNETVDIGGVEVRVETACHLIEPFAGTYQALSDMSGTEFRPYRVQPVAWRSSGYRLYASRWSIGLEGVRLVSGAFAATVGERLGPWAPERFRRVGSRVPAAQRRSDVLEWWHRRCPLIVTGAKVHGPVGGIAAFIDNLVNRLHLAGVEIRHCTVSFIEKLPDGAVAVTVGDVAEKFDRVVVGESTVLTESDAGRMAEYSHVLLRIVGVDKSLPSYVHFPGDPLIHRMSVSAVLNECETLLLVQLREEAVADLTTIIRQRLRKAGSGSLGRGDMHTVARFRSNHFAHSGAVPDFGDLEVLATVGDLARVVGHP